MQKSATILKIDGVPKSRKVISKSFLVSHVAVAIVSEISGIIDVAIRRIVAVLVVKRCRQELVQDRIKMACERTQIPDGAVFHSDRGWQYTAKKTKKLILSILQCRKKYIQALDIKLQMRYRIKIHSLICPKILTSFSNK